MVHEKLHRQFQIFQRRNLFFSAPNPAPNFGVKQMQALAKQIPRLEESVLLQEWDTYTDRVKIPDLRVSDNVQYT